MTAKAPKPAVPAALKGAIARVHFFPGDIQTLPDGDVLVRHIAGDICVYDSNGQPHVFADEAAYRAANDNRQASKPIIAVHRFELRGTSRIPRRDFLYGRHHIRRYLTALFAAGGLGKSSLCVTDALAMVTGKPLLGDKPERPLRVWLTNVEDPLEELERKVEATAAHFGITDEDIGGRLFLSSGRESDFIIAAESRSGVVIQKPVVEAVEAHAKANDIDVIIIDPFVSTHHVNENDNAAIQSVAATWLAIADAVGCSLELAHHVTKGMGEVDENSGRGAGALKDKARAVRVLNRMSAEEATRWGISPENRFSYFRADLAKANLAAAGGRSIWYRFVNVPMGNGDGLMKPQDHTGVVERWFPPTEDDIAAKAEADRAALVADVEAETLGGIKTRLHAGNYKRSDQAKHWAGNVVAEILGIDLAAPGEKARVKGMLAAWIASGDLEVVSLEDAHRRLTPHIKPCGTTSNEVPQM